jgi:hypothetical protein
MKLVVDNTDTKATADVVTTEALAWPDRARALKIIDVATYTAAGVMLTGVKALRGKVKETFDPIVEAANKTHKEACKQRTNADAPLVEAEKILKAAIASFDDERARIDREEHASRLAAVQAQSETLTLETAAALESAGLHEQAAQILEVGVAAPAAVIIQKSTPDVAGISFTNRWTGKVTDKVAFLKTAIERPELLDLIEIRQADINKLASTFKGKLASVYPGLEGVSEKIVNAKAS